MIRIRLLLAVLLLAISASPAWAEIKLAIAEPYAESTRSGIGQISGWAVSDVPIVSVEALIDGVSLGPVPYGGTRQDVAKAFPDFPNSEFSGWSMKWNYGLLAQGEHLLTIIVTDEMGSQLIKEHVFSSIAFKSAFIADPELVSLLDADITTTEDGRIVISGAEIDGEILDVVLLWDTGSQQFLISEIIGGDSQPSNKPPVANAGYSFSVDTGEVVTITGSGSDSDGQIVSWNWERVSGPVVALQFPNTNRVQFTAPGTAGTIVLRLTVTDEDGAKGSDEATVTVKNPPPPPNEAPTANAGPNRTVQQGDEVTLSGSGNDPDGAIVNWSWQQISGPSVSISGANSQEAGFTAPDSAGNIKLRLTVTDDDGDSDTDDVTITVEGDPDPDNTTGETVISMLTTINAARGEARKCGNIDYPAQAPLSWSSSLADIARLHSMDMARQGYFSHTSKDGTSMGNRVFPYWSGNRVGENIAASSIDRPNSYVVNLWLESEGHCKLIMDPNFTHAGIGAGHDSDNGHTMHHFWTLDFGG